MAEPKKKMTVMQLTVLTAVNMMGSGIIMLPTNMAKVGAISLLSWIVTAVGSMAIAYGFAQAGVLQSRSGGMAAYAEEAHGKSGFFMTFYLYFFSLAIGNVAIAISAVGYLATFFPWLTSAPIATTIGVIGLIWLTTVANFGGPKRDGPDRRDHGVGRDHPRRRPLRDRLVLVQRRDLRGRLESQGMSLGEGMGSSISLTLWAFLGMESAAQNSDAVENPKRDVPLACLFGTLGAAVVYVLSTTVIQGIVPNAELAESTGPFGLVYAQMFNPTVGSIIMALAVMACLGLAARLAVHDRDDRQVGGGGPHVPDALHEGERHGRADHGHARDGRRADAARAVDDLPHAAEQFYSLVNLAVVTNVVPYIMALSALVVMMKKAGHGASTYR